MNRISISIRGQASLPLWTQYCVASYINKHYSPKEWKLWLFDGFIWFFSAFKGTVVYQKYFVTRFIAQSNHHVRTEKIREKKQLATYFLLCTGIHLQIWHPFSLPPISYYVFVEFTLFVISYRTNTFLSSIKKRLKWSFFLVFSQCICGDCFVKWSV